MTPERWRQVGALFARVLDEPSAGRAAWLAGADVPPDVRQDVAALLAAHDSDGTFLETPVDRDAVQAMTVPPAVDAALVPGATVGPYRLVRELGRGGMGIVFEAEDLRLSRRVALKAVVAGADAAGEARLRLEARAAAALVHPNIATIYALDDIDGRAFISSELLEGETLRARLGRGRLERAETLAIAHDLASALDAAHARGVVHRDLKPENILCTSDGRVKILDFGLARFDEGRGAPPSVTRLTLPGLVAGTPGYMAPEQLLGGDSDARVDQYALGVLLVEMATGVNPFESASLAATIAVAMASDGLPRPLDGTMVAPDVAAIANRCTRHRPEDRFPRTADLLAAIDACRAGTAALSSPGDRPGSTPAGTGGGHAALPHPARRPPLWWWRFHQAAAAAVYWAMVVPAWLVHRDMPRGLAWFIACLAATIVAANVRLHLRFSAAVLPQELPAQRARTRGWVAIADWALILLWASGGAALMETSREWAVVFFAFAIGAALAVGLIEPATTRAAFDAHDAGRGTA